MNLSFQKNNMIIIMKLINILTVIALRSIKVFSETECSFQCFICQLKLVLVYNVFVHILTVTCYIGLQSKQYIYSLSLYNITLVSMEIIMYPLHSIQTPALNIGNQRLQSSPSSRCAKNVIW